jgi:hypothetical protein
MTLLLIIGFLNILVAVLVGSDVYDSWVKLRQAQIISQDSALVNDLYQAEKYLSMERAAALSVMYVSPDTAASLQVDMAASRKEANAYLNKGLRRVGKYSGDASVEERRQKANKDLDDLQELRRQLDAEMEKPADARDGKLPDEIFDATTNLIFDVRKLTSAYIQPIQSADATVSRQMMFKRSIWETTEYAGREYAVLGRLVAQEKQATPEMQQNLLAWRTLIDHGWQTARDLVAGTRLETKLAPYINEAQTHYFLTFGQIKDIFYSPAAASSDTPYPLTTEMWLVLSSEAVDSLAALKDAALKQRRIMSAASKQGRKRKSSFPC